ncbi:TPA: hypothetical protein ACMEW2_004863 [Klebsiella pneumoniae]|uniref:hypothetical protein n=1 Tax=Klebsiella pneumoniae complex TaxID=3390273 RepID=UPI0015E89885|nr:MULTISPECIES: hypothetical protein [Klebsiella]MCQ6415100.1 hypothetical protein [Klebsiella pneumoniae]MCQ6420604.1 hypothetical protein [Klebsiella pneumoniae]MDE9344849.1 hypothetical protein [Klebsiella variicola]MDL4672656.1 hypothetical protein [Klebsiella pneumoniae]MDL4676229.1 hypothetical protein [Klebsiella pneumoniae]
MRTNEDKTLTVPFAAVDAGLFVHALVLLLGWAYDPHLTEQRLSLNLAELGSEMTMTIAHSGNHLTSFIISRKSVLYLNSIEINRDTFATRFDAFARIVVENC